MRTALQESFWERLAGVVTLKRPTYEAIQHDPEATGQSWLIVILLGLANGIALITTPIVTVFPGMPEDVVADATAIAAAFTFETTERRLLAIATGIVGAILSWYLSAWLLRFIGNRMVRRSGRAVTAVEMRRLVAWGYSPQLAFFLAPIPVVGGLLATLGALWAFVSGVMAVRTAFDVGIGRAIAIEIAAFVLVALIVIVIVTFVVTIAILLS